MDAVSAVFLHLCGALSLMLLQAAWLPWRFARCRWQLLAPLVTLADSLCFWLIKSSVPAVLVSTGVKVVCTLCFFGGIVLWRVLLPLAGALLDKGLAYLAAAILCRTQKIPFARLQAVAPLRITAALLARLLLFFVCYLVFLSVRTFVRHILPPGRWLQLLVYPCVSIGAGAVLLTLQARQAQDRATWGLMLLALGLVIATLLQLLLRSEAEAAARRENQRLQQQLAQQAQGMQELTRAYDAQRSATHDFVNHLLAVDGLLSETGGQAHSYIQKTLDACQEIPALFHTGNAVADALLNRHAALARAAGVDMTVQGCDLSGLRLADELLTVILGNLLDNAREACARCEGEKVLRVTLQATGGNWVFTIANSCPPDTSPDMATHKPDKRLHGYGLRNVQAALKKCGGLLHTEVVQGRYLASVCIPDKGP